MEIQIVPYITPFPAKGSLLLKEYSNTGTPILDSLTRESIQNSLDAAMDGPQPVIMDFVIGDFDKKKLFSHCDKLEEILKSKFSCIPNRFLCFRDYNTEGLTGNVVDKGDQNTGNYFKLVLDIGNEQTNVGAGGSCGIGKSLYFRLGVKGLVVYYSRIKIDNGAFESRLIAMMVENERKADSVIPSAKNGTSKTGIAYWGQLDNDKILPITDEFEIAEILDVFNIKPYNETETGTTVILPFINEEKLLTDNQKDYEIGRTPIKPTWRNSMSDFLKISIQRWYFARLNNRKYRTGKYLSISINGQPLMPNDMVPCFKVFQALYNRAAGCNENDLDDILSGNNEVKTEDIKIARYSPLQNKKTGTLAFIMASKDLLGMSVPTLCYSPYIYCDTEIKETETNTPIIGYCRKPGMIVNYETSGDWLYKVPNSPDKDHYLLAMFVLDPSNKMGETTLNEYVRKMEPNDHMQWKDGSFEGANYSFIRFTKRSVSTVLSSFLSGDDNVESKRKMSELGKLYSWILPPEDFGRKPSPIPGNGGREGKQVKTHRKIKYTLLSNKLQKNSVEVHYGLEAVQKIEAIEMGLYVGTTDGKDITLDEWESMGATIPFYIQKVNVFIKKLDDKSCSNVYPLSLDKYKYDDSKAGLSLYLKKTETNARPYSLCLDFDEGHSFKIEFYFTINITSRGAFPVIKLI